MASTFSLQGKLGLDAKDFVDGAKKAEKAVGDVADEMEDLPAAAKKSGSDAGDSLGSSMTGAFAALGVGAAIGGLFAMAFSREMDRQNTTKVLVGQFGKTVDEADRYSKIAADLYAGNWGDSMEDVGRAIGAVDQRLVQTGQIGEDSLEGVTEKAMALADTFDTDVSDVVRSVSQLMLNGLAPDADAAMDILTTGLQNGSNAAGDLFDSVDEYSQHFAAFGLSAEDMMAMFSDGMANGQRDTDKLADAVKEMRIRTVDGSAATREAYDLIGLSAEETTAKIVAGGDSARDTFINILKRIEVIEDPIDKNTAAVGLLGTQFEDLGPTAIGSLLAIEDGLGDVEGATDRVVDSFVTTEAGLESLKRRGSNALGTLGTMTGEWIDSALGAPDILDRIEDSLKVLGDTGPTTFDDAVAAVTPYVTSIEEAEFMVRTYAESVDGLTTALSKQVPTTDDLIASQTAEWKSARQAAAETDALAAEVNGLGGDARSTSGDLDALTSEFDAMKASLSDRSAFLTAMDSFEGLEQKGIEAFAAASTGAVDASEKLRDYEQDQIKAKEAVIKYAEEVGKIPAEVVSEINTLIDEGSFAEAERRLSSIERRRIINIAFNVPKIPTFVAAPGNAEGTDFWRGGPTWVGEKGPELLNLPRGSQIIPHDRSVAMFAQSVAAPPATRPGPATGFANGNQGMPGLVINHNGPTLSAADVSRGYTLARLAQS